MTAPSLDHVFLAVARGAPEAEELSAAGFTEGSPNTHAGQGTACRRFFFENGFLEFAWIGDDDEVGSSVVSPTGLRDRLAAASDASHVGVCVRLGPGEDETPVSTWAYRPLYLQAEHSILIAENSHRLDEPLLFFMPHAPKGSVGAPRHANGAKAISRVEIVMRGVRPPSPELGWLTASGLVHVRRGQAETLSVELDDGLQGNRVAVEGASSLEISW